MPNANWSNPTLTSTYTNFVSEVKNRDEDLALQFDGTTSTNIPTGTIRWDSSANRWKKWTGAAWGELTSTYALTALTTTGSVGIGTSSPTSKLDLVDSAADPVLSIRAGSTFSPILYFEASGVNAGAIKYDRATQALTFSNNSSSTERLRIDFSGNVGIGTSAPNARLQVDAPSGGRQYSTSVLDFSNIHLDGFTSNSATSALTFSSGGGGGAAIAFSRGAGYDTGISFWTNPDSTAVGNAATQRMVINSVGNVGIGTTSPQNPLVVSNGGANGFEISSATNSGTTSYLLSYNRSTSAYTDMRFDASAFRFEVSATERMRLTSTGLGIGTNAPSGLFDARGFSYLSGAQIRDSSHVAKGYVQGDTRGFLLASDGSTNIVFDVNGIERARINTSGRLLVGTTSTTDPALLQINGDALVNSLNAGPLAGARNRIINGGMQIDQRNAGASISSGVSAVTYSVDRWYVYATGAAVSAQRVTSSNSAFTSALRIIGAASNTGFSIGQRIEVQNSYDLAGKTVTLSFYAASSASVTLTWKTFYASVANDFTTQTQSNTGTQATTSTLTKYSATFTLSASATTGVAVEFSVASLTSGSIDITGVQLELGSASTPFEQRSFGAELELCQRYFASETCYGFGYSPAAGNFRSATSYLPVNMRVTPTVGVTSASGSNVSGETAQVQSSRNVGFFTSVLAAGAYTHDITFTATAEL